MTRSTGERPLDGAELFGRPMSVNVRATPCIRLGAGLSRENPTPGDNYREKHPLVVATLQGVERPGRTGPPALAHLRWPPWPRWSVSARNPCRNAHQLDSKAISGTRHVRPAPEVELELSCSAPGWLGGEPYPSPLHASRPAISDAEYWLGTGSTGYMTSPGRWAWPKPTTWPIS